MPHLSPPEGGGNKGGDLTTFQSNSPPLGLIKLLGQIARGMPVEEYKYLGI